MSCLVEFFHVLDSRVEVCALRSFLNKFIKRMVELFFPCSLLFTSLDRIQIGRSRLLSLLSYSISAFLVRLRPRNRWAYSRLAILRWPNFLSSVAFPTIIIIYGIPLSRAVSFWQVCVLVGHQFIPRNELCGHDRAEIRVSMHLNYDRIRFLLSFALDNFALWLAFRWVHFRRALVWVCRKLLLELHQLRLLLTLSSCRRGFDLHLFRLAVVYYLNVSLVDSWDEVDRRDRSEFFLIQIFNRGCLLLVLEVVHVTEREELLHVAILCGIFDTCLLP